MQRRSSLPGLLCAGFASTIAVALVGPQLGIAQDVTPSASIQTPDDARTHGLDSLKLALESDGGPPLPSDLSSIVVDREAAIQLGKALFWDMQVGSDGVQACASCHFQAGADIRARNQINPDLLRTAFDRNGDIRGFGDAAARPDTNFEFVGPDDTLEAADFPFVKYIQMYTKNADGSLGPARGNSNDIASSMGVFFTRFEGTRPGQPVDQGTRLLDPVFNLKGKTTRRVEPRNTPTVINAVLNFTNFWDGRANNVFNGVNPFGLQDPTARVFELQSDGSVSPARIALRNASLASQAVGPPLSHFEMSFGDPDNGNARSFPEVGKKLLRGRSPIKPLGKQLVASDDSVLGSLSAQPDPGLRTTYRRLIQQAFDKKYWGYQGTLSLDSTVPSPEYTGGQVTVESQLTPQAGTSADTLDADPALSTDLRSTDGSFDSRTRPGFSQMEANFSLFFGVSVMLYEATLISDETPFDQWMESGKLTKSFGKPELAGLNLFADKGRCVNCHGGPELTNASVRNAQNGRNVIEPMPMGLGTAFYDNGFYNISVVPTTDDLGRGGKDLNGQPLAFSRQALFERVLGLDVGFPIIGDRDIPAEDDAGNRVCDDVNGNGLCDRNETLSPNFRRVAVDGAFKAPGLRNQTLMGPYMHNGSFATLRQVVEFYNRGGNFCRLNLADLDPDISPIGFSDQEMGQLVSFLVALTDERVRRESAPFDHPELFVPATGFAETGMLRRPPVGSGGVSSKNALSPFLGLNPGDSLFTPVGNCSK